MTTEMLASPSSATTKAYWLQHKSLRFNKSVRRVNMQATGFGGPQQPSLLHAPNFSFHSCLYFSHHSSSQVDSVSPQRMILYRSCSSGVQATPWISPFVTMPRLRSACREA